MGTGGDALRADEVEIEGGLDVSDEDGVGTLRVDVDLVTGLILGLV